MYVFMYLQPMIFFKNDIVNAMRILTLISELELKQTRSQLWLKCYLMKQM